MPEKVPDLVKIMRCINTSLGKTKEESLQSEAIFVGFLNTLAENQEKKE